MDSQNASRILEKIIEKGGLYGKCAKIYQGDSEKESLFIKECAQQCHNELAKELWGKRLVDEILNFNKESNENKKN